MDLSSASLALADTVHLLAQNSTAAATVHVTAYTTFIAEPTIFSFNNVEYTVTEPTTLTITDCPCTLSATPSSSSSVSIEPTVAPVASSTVDEGTTTVKVTDFTTYCPEATTFVHNNQTYTVTAATTLTISSCPESDVTITTTVCPETTNPVNSAPAPAPTPTTVPAPKPTTSEPAAAPVPAPETSHSSIEHPSSPAAPPVVVLTSSAPVVPVPSSPGTEVALANTANSQIVGTTVMIAAVIAYLL